MSGCYVLVKGPLVDGATMSEVPVMTLQKVLADIQCRVEHQSTAPAEQTDPSDLVRHFLDAMENRDLPAATACLADGFTMQFPGSATMTQLNELIEWSKPRYSKVSKTYDRFDVMVCDGSTSIVYCIGTLSGVWRDGTTFSGIRFIDRFEVADGKITQQDVWNDMAEEKSRK